MMWLFLVGRVLFGGFFVVNAWNHFSKSGMIAQYAASKKVPMPKVMVVGSGFLMLLGGIGILAGVWIPGAVAVLTLFLIPAAFFMHDFWKVQDPQQKGMQMILFMRNLALTGAAFMALGIPEPWPYALFA